MAYIPDFVPYIVNNSGAVPEVQMQHLLRMAIASFMRDTHIAQAEMYIDLDCDQTDFLLDLPDCRALDKVLEVWESPRNDTVLFNKDTWNKLTPAGMVPHARYYGADVYTVNTVGTRPNNSIQLEGKVGKPRRLCVIYAWKIKNQSCEVPDFILEDWIDAIIYRTMAYLHASLDFEQRNVREMEANLAAYATEVAIAKTAIRASNTKALIRLKTPRNFFR